MQVVRKCLWSNKYDPDTESSIHGIRKWLRFKNIIVMYIKFIPLLKWDLHNAKIS